MRPVRLHVIETAPYTCYPATDDLDARIEWVGLDDRDVELEVIAVELPDLWLVIQVMPTVLRRKSSPRNSACSAVGSTSNARTCATARTDASTPITSSGPSSTCMPEIGRAHV